MKFTKNLVLITLCLIFNPKAFGQIIYHQDVFYGGVTGDGYNPFINETTGTFDVYIESGSSIRKAYLFVTLWEREPQDGLSFIPDRSIIFNGTEIVLSASNTLTSPFIVQQTPTSILKLRILAIDVTDLATPSTTSYTLTPPPNQNPTAIGGVYSDYYLYIAYENTSLNRTNSLIVINNQNSNSSVSYSVNDINNVELSNNLGFSFNSTAFCDTFQDGSYVYVDGSLLGLVGGNEDLTSEPICTGVRGSFYYQNAILFGLDNDVANNTMGGVDAIANIESYIIDPTIFEIRFDHQSPTWSGRKTNPVLELFLTYTTPCDTFSVSVPNDTTLCYGETLQLNATTSTGSASAVEWFTSTGSATTVPGLSCSDCPDPIFTADSSMFYTVRIWNNDSCSVVRPLKINVSRTQIDSLDITPPDCGASNGSIVVYAHNSLNDTLNFSVNGTSTGSATVTGTTTVSGLAEGTYTISVQDAMGCPVVDSTIVLNAVNSTVSQFSLNPMVGNVPLEIDVYNQSQNATYYEWYINGVYAGDDLVGYTIENGGEHVFELVAWRYDPSCADTFSLIIWASEVIIPTAFTPNNDGDNDVWELVNLDAHFPKNKVKVFNRWGNLLFESKEGNYATNPWNGTYNGEPVPVGSYYFIIETHTKGVDDFKGSVTVVRE